MTINNVKNLVNLILDVPYTIKEENSCISTRGLFYFRVFVEGDYSLGGFFSHDGHEKGLSNMNYSINYILENYKEWKEIN